MRMNIPITQLVVNPSNPRFEPMRDQGQAIQIMLNKEETSIKKLARDIVKHGLNPTKSLAVYGKNGKYVIQEGNRRVVALKLLDNPNMTDNAKLRKFFIKLKTKSSIPSSVSCAVFESQSDAKHWVELEHTGPNQGAGIVPWDTIQKQRFLGKSSQLVKTVEYIGDDLDISRVHQTTLERLVSTPYVRKKIGLTFSNGELKELKSRDVILKNFDTAFSAMSKRGFSVRKLDSLDDRKEWINHVLDKDQETSAHQRASTHTARDPPPSRSRKRLIPGNCVLSIKEPRINDIFLELKKGLTLSGQNATPNAVAVLFRVFLEASLDKYIAVTSLSLSPEPKIKEKIDVVAEDMKKRRIATREQLLAIRRTSSGSKTEISHIQWFHQYVHNSTIQPESDSLKAKWDNWQEFFEILWGHINNQSQHRHGV